MDLQRIYESDKLTCEVYQIEDCYCKFDRVNFPKAGYYVRSKRPVSGFAIWTKPFNTLEQAEFYAYQSI